MLSIKKYLWKKNINHNKVLVSAFAVADNLDRWNNSCWKFAKVSVGQRICAYYFVYANEDTLYTPFFRRIHHHHQYLSLLLFDPASFTGVVAFANRAITNRKSPDNWTSASIAVGNALEMCASAVVLLHVILYILSYENVNMWIWTNTMCASCSSATLFLLLLLLLAIILICLSIISLCSKNYCHKWHFIERAAAVAVQPPSQLHCRYTINEFWSNFHAKQREIKWTQSKWNNGNGKETCLLVVYFWRRE